MHAVRNWAGRIRHSREREMKQTEVHLGPTLSFRRSLAPLTACMCAVRESCCSLSSNERSHFLIKSEGRERDACSCCASKKRDKKRKPTARQMRRRGLGSRKRGRNGKGEREKNARASISRVDIVWRWCLSQQLASIHGLLLMQDPFARFRSRFATS